MRQNTIYVVTMYRWGDRERHSYVLGAYSTKTKAEKAGEAEREYRGWNKYYPEALEVSVDGVMPREGFKRIVELKRNPYFAGELGLLEAKE